MRVYYRGGTVTGRNAMLWLGGEAVDMGALITRYENDIIRSLALPPELIKNPQE